MKRQRKVAPATGKLYDTPTMTKYLKGGRDRISARIDPVVVAAIKAYSDKTGRSFGEVLEEVAKVGLQHHPAGKKPTRPK